MLFFHNKRSFSHIENILLYLFLFFFSAQNSIAHPSHINLVTIEIVEDSLRNNISFKLSLPNLNLVFTDNDDLTTKIENKIFDSRLVKEFEKYLSKHFLISYDEEIKTVNYIISSIQSDQEYIYLNGSFKNMNNAKTLSISNSIFANENPEGITLLIFSGKESQSGYRFDRNNSNVLINLDNGKENHQ